MLSFFAFLLSAWVYSGSAWPGSCAGRPTFSRYPGGLATFGAFGGDFYRSI